MNSLARSRDFLAQAVSRVRAGVEKNPGVGEGPEINVEPFDARNVSTAAGLVKLGTSIAADRRRRANFAARQQDAELARERVRAETARIRAEASYYEGTGRQTRAPGKPPVTLGRDIPNTPFHAGDLKSDFDAWATSQRNANAQANATQRLHNAGRIAASRLALDQIDKNVKRYADSHTTRVLQTPEARMLFQRAASNDPDVSGQALQALYINPDWFSAATPQQKIAGLQQAKQALYDRIHARVTNSANAQYDALRQRHQAIVNEASLGEPADDGGATPADAETEQPAVPEPDDNDYLDVVPDGRGGYQVAPKKP